MLGMSKEEGIKQVMGGRHVVILGAGASIASTFFSPEKSGKRLPSMDNFIEVVGLEDIIKEVPDKSRAKNFERLFANLHNEGSELIAEIEKRVHNYFSDMQLPDTPTIYDYLVMSLRGKDLIATFNWDPFLYQAFCRCQEYTRNMPSLSFLHGCVSIGYSEEDEISGPAGMFARQDGGYFEPTKLLYPIEQKNYTNDKFISVEWERVKYWLSKENGSVRATIFGYGAPTSDVEAVSLLSDAWGTNEEREMEQFEVIDITAEEELRKRWDRFIHSHHYQVTNNYFSSSLGLNPRRTCESYFSHYLPTNIKHAFRQNNPVPKDFETLEDLWQWHKPLIEAEEREGAV
jgi:hypothetical protein